MFEKFYLVLFNGFEVDSSTFGNPAEWVTAIISGASLYFTWKGFNYLKTQIGFQEKALLQQETQLNQQQDQLNLQKMQIEEQAKEEAFKQSLALIEVAYKRLSDILSSRFFTGTLPGSRFIQSRTIENEWKSFELFFRDVDNFAELIEVRSSLFSMINISSLVLLLTEKINNQSINKMFGGLIFDILNGFGYRFVFFSIVKVIIVHRGITIECRVSRYLIEGAIQSNRVSEVTIEGVNFFKHEYFKKLNDFFISEGLEPLTPPSNLA